jgi:phosphatidylinositol glycan class X
MESYYEKHGSLLDSDFQDFVARALPSGICGILQDNLNLVPRLSVLKRNLIGEGSHRHLSTSIRLNIDPKSITELLPTLYCEVIIIERLPSGVFADPFELQHLLQRGGKILLSFFLTKS